MASSLIALIRDSVAEPSETADRLLAQRPTMGVILQGAVLVAVLDALVLGAASGGSLVLPTPAGDMALTPFAHAGVLLASLVMSAGAIQVGGRILGGKGRFEEALLVVVWLEVLALAVQIATLIVALILPPFAGILGLVGVVILLWCVVHFTRALHGFAGYGRTIAALLLGIVALIATVSFLLGLLGYGPPSDV